MPRFAELEIHLQRRDEQACTIGFRFLALNDDATRIDDAIGTFAIPKLKSVDPNVDPIAYGRKLSEALFRDAAVAERFAEYRKKSPEGLRVQLVVPPDLHPIRWEAILEPDPLRKDAHLFADELLFFSRHLNSDSWNPARSRRKSDLSALVVVANPKGDFSVTEDD